MMTIGSHPMIVTPMTNASVRYTTNRDIANPRSQSVSHRIGSVMNLRIPPTTRFTSPRIKVNTSREVVPEVNMTPCRYPYRMSPYMTSVVKRNLSRNRILRNIIN